MAPHITGYVWKRWPCLTYDLKDQLDLIFPLLS